MAGALTQSTSAWVDVGSRRAWDAGRPDPLADGSGRPGAVRDPPTVSAGIAVCAGLGAVTGHSSCRPAGRARRPRPPWVVSLTRALGRAPPGGTPGSP